MKQTSHHVNADIRFAVLVFLKHKLVQFIEGSVLTHVQDLVVLNSVHFGLIEDDLVRHTLKD